MRRGAPYLRGELVVVIDCSDLDRSAQFWAGGETAAPGKLGVNTSVEAPDTPIPVTTTLPSWSVCASGLIASDIGGSGETVVHLFVPGS